MSDISIQEKCEKQEGEIKFLTKRLHDLFTVHQGLIKEKEALASALSALKNKETSSIKPGNEEKQIHNEAKPGTSADHDQTKEEASGQEITRLIESITQLSEEKQRMEERLKADNKEIRIKKEEAEKKYGELETRLEEVKIQLNAEKKERISESNDHKVRLTELQNVIAKERRSKTSHDKSNHTLKSELESTKQKLDNSDGRLKDVTAELNSLQGEIAILERDHQTAIQSEKERARVVEEQSKKLSAVQEERVVNLEMRLAELSETVGSYDRLHQQDQSEIITLKNHIVLLDRGMFTPTVENSEKMTAKEFSEDESVDSIIHRILDLKSELHVQCHKTGRKVDFGALFVENTSNNVHENCTEEYNKLLNEFERYRNETKQQLSTQQQDTSRKQIMTLENQVRMLQERLKVQSEHSKDMEKEFKLQVDQLKKAMKNEKTRFKETLSASEADYRGRLCLLEQQLQKQRERSLGLLEEKEQEIHSLQSTFQMFLPNYRGTETAEDEDQGGKVSPVTGLMQKTPVEGPRMLHYATELARRDVDIANLRKNKHKIESALRDLQKAAIADTEKHRDERQALREEIARLKRCQTREGANLEYLKNVVLSFLLSDDPNSKRHMCNAISAVLKFSDAEMEKVLQHSANRWWNRGSYL